MGHVYYSKRLKEEMLMYNDPRMRVYNDPKDVSITVQECYSNMIHMMFRSLFRLSIYYVSMSLLYELHYVPYDIPYALSYEYYSICIHIPFVGAAALTLQVQTFMVTGRIDRHSSQTFSYSW